MELMIEAYEALGMHDLAADTQRVIETTFNSASES
jgi:outer membrane protein assembly factor BamD (BamD/ComL family)